MTRKVLLVMAVGIAVIALLGVGVVLLAPGSGAVAGVNAPGVEAQATAPTTSPYTIHVTWPSGWISQVGIVQSVTDELAKFGLNYYLVATTIDAEYFTVSTTAYHDVSQAMAVGESTTCDFMDTPMSNDAATMNQYVNKNQAGFFAWGEGLASTMGMYAPVAKQARVLPFLSGDSAYAVQVNGHFREEPATWEFVLIPKDKNQYFTIFLHSYGMCEDELWNLQRTTTFTQK